MERNRLLFVLTTYESSTPALLGNLLTTTFDTTQLPLPAVGRPLEALLQGWWRLGRRVLSRRAVSA